MGTFTPHALEEQDQSDYADMHPYVPGPARAGAFDGFGFSREQPLGPAYPVLQGMGSAVMKGLDTATDAMRVFGDYENAGGQDAAAGVKPLTADEQEAAKQQQEDERKAYVAALRPDPATHGVAANVLHGVGEVATLGLLTGPYGAGAIEAHAGYKDLIDQGVDKTTALEVSGLEGVATAAGLRLPGLSGIGENLFVRLATGAGANVAFGGASRFGTAQLLEHGGYSDMAAQYRVFDGEAVMTDAILGAAFGGLHHFTHGPAADLRTKLDEAAGKGDLDGAAVNAALVARLRQVDRTDTAPGAPVDTVAAATHDARQKAALDQVVRGEPVDVADIGARDAAYLHVPKDEAPAYEALSEYLKDAGVHDELTKLARMEGELQARRDGKPIEEGPRPATTETDQPIDANQPGSASSGDVGLPESQRLDLTAPRGEIGSSSPQAQARRVLDLFGQDTSTAQGIHDLQRAKDEARSPNKDVSVETGNPNDLFSKARKQIDLTELRKPDEEAQPNVKLTEQILTEKPDLSLPDARAAERQAARRFKEADAAVAKRKQTEPPDARHDSMLEYLARHGEGLNSAEAEAHGIDKADMHLASAKVGIRRAFRKDGMSFDQAAEMLHEAGYPVADENGHYNPNTLLDMIDRELAGDKVFSHQNETGGGDRLESERAWDAWQAAKTAAEQAERDAPKVMEALTNCAVRH